METPDLHNLPLNPNPPRIMHIDLNSCFATVEQQANKHLRGKPLLITPYNTNRGFIIAPSIEAKRHGIKVGNQVSQAKLLLPNAVVRTPDSDLIRDVHVKFKKICMDYSPNVAPRSIDELVIDFEGMDYFLKDKTIQQIGHEIKQRFRKEIGEWISCSVGIAPNRFLAKVAASYQKPDGLITIDHTNVIDIYKTLELTDLPYIKYRNQARLKAGGIFTVMDFLNAPLDLLKKEVFKSINGYYWYKRLRGWEVDQIEFQRKSFGQDYALHKSTADPKELARLLMKLCEKMGRRLRKYGKAAHGINIACIYSDRTWWNQQKKSKTPLYTTLELFRAAQYVLDIRPTQEKKLSKLSVSCYDLQEATGSQTSLFEDAEDKLKKVSEALDAINDRYGEFVITPASMMNMNDTIVDLIAFGGVKEIKDVNLKT
ncbi:DNA polymerase IV [soil metagenome]